MKKKKNDNKNPTMNTNPIGRPSLKTEERLVKLLELSRQPKTNQQIAEIIGVDPTTVGRWLKQDLELCMAVREFKQEADEMVVASLYKTAVGFEYQEQTETDKGVYTNLKYSKPDVRAQQFWLKNRQPKQWKDRVELVHEATGKLMIESDDGKEDIDV